MKSDLPLKTLYGLLEGDHSSLRPLTSYMREAKRLDAITQQPCSELSGCNGDRCSTC